nr:hypothetical protein [uncultured Ruminococcus sp.]
MLDWKFVSIITYIVMYKIIIANSGIATNAITLETFFKLYALALVRHIINRTTIVLRLARITNKYLNKLDFVINSSKVAPEIMDDE